jgi:subtilisin family serine protease
MSSAPYGRGALFSLGGLLGAAALMLSACQDANSPTVSSPQSPSDPAASFAATPGQGLGRVIPGAYIVVFKAAVTDAPGLARHLVGAAGGTLRHSYGSALKGFAADLPARALDALQHNPNVAYVEADQVVQADDINPASWGLDRVDQRKLPLSRSYNYSATGAGVNVYIIDTGIWSSHAEFGGRVVGGYSAIKGRSNTEDCNGHGTHVAGTVGGVSYGVAKGVSLYAVRVLDCAGSGTWSDVIAGIDWVAANRTLPAVANMSLGGGRMQSVNDAVEASIASGVTFAVSAGNSARDACNYSPASAPSALTVGATTATDARATYSNIGPCVDLFAPGSGITSAWIGSDTASNTISGTSMASPHATGAAALYLETHSAAPPTEVAQAVLASATVGVLTGAGTGSPNLLLFTGDAGTSQPPACLPKGKSGKCS